MINSVNSSLGMENAMQPDIILKASHISKNFGLTHALRDVSIQLERGEIIGLIGENGSGKSTFSSIISGIYPATSGTLELRGEPYEPTNIIDAQSHGISMIAQEMGTLGGIRVADNIFIGKEDTFSNHGIVNHKKMYEAARHAMEKVGITDVDVTALTSKYSFEERKLIEVVRALYSDPEIFIVDETTTALSQKGREIIYKVINEFKLQNKSVLFISHDLDELTSVCSKLIVLRDGVLIKELDRPEFDQSLIKELMVGREMTGDYYRSDYDESADKEVVIDVENIHVQGHLSNVSLQLHKGEILGIGGLTDCGMHELGKVMFGDIKPLYGSVMTKDGHCIKSEKEAVLHHIGYVSKNRDQESIILTASITDNIVLPSFNKLDNFGVITDRSENRFVMKQIEEMSIKCHDIGQDVGELSGGNKQKVAFGKWLGNGSKIFILDCPTRGIDIGVKAAMYQLMYQLKKEGNSILMISEELPELIGMADRILIMKDGKIRKSFTRSRSLAESELIREMV